MALAYRRLNGAERAVWNAIRSGAVVDGSTGDGVRAQLLYELLAGLAPAPAVVRVLRLRGARIIGTFDLEAASLRCPLVLQQCSIDGPVNLNEVRARRSACPAARSLV